MSINNIKDYYYILGLSKNASKDDIKKAYRKLSLKFHPDQNSGDKFFEERFKDLHEAYETLVDDLKRKLYDAKLSGTGANNAGEKDYFDTDSSQHQQAETQQAYQAANRGASQSSSATQKKKSNKVLFTILGTLLFLTPFVLKIVIDKINKEDNSKNYYDSSQNKTIQTSSFDTGNVSSITKTDTSSYIQAPGSSGTPPPLPPAESPVADTQNNNNQSTGFKDDDGYTPTALVYYFFRSLNGSDCHSAFGITYNPTWESRGESWFCSSEAFGSVTKVLIHEIHVTAQTFDGAEIYVEYYAEDNYNGNKCFKQNIALQKLAYTDNKSRWRIIKMKNVEEPVACDENQ